MNVLPNAGFEPGPPPKEMRPFVLILLAFALFMAYRVLLPFLHPIIFAAVLASLFNPLTTRLATRFRGRRTYAALLSTAGAGLIIVIPLAFLFVALVGQGVDTMDRIQAWVAQGGVGKLLSHPMAGKALDWINSHFPEANLSTADIRRSLINMTSTAGQTLLDGGTALAGNMASLTLDFCIMLFVMYYLGLHGHEVVDIIKKLSPLQEEREDRILAKIRDVSRSVLLGSFLTAVAHGTVGGIGLAIVGIPPLFWGAVMAVASPVPLVGTALVWIPVSIYLLLTGDWQWALFFALWAGVIGLVIDNMVRPFLMQGPGSLPPFYVLIAMLGGLQVYGVAGLLYGPLIIAFAAVMLYIYAEEFEPWR